MYNIFEILAYMECDIVSQELSTCKLSFYF